MGAVLVRSSFSANIKERRDCSTALFDERGRMIAQAEHIPVRLGALPDAVAAMNELHDYAERRVRTAIAALPDGRYEAHDVLEAVGGELELRTAVTIDGDELEIDFTGTARQHDGNLNCPLAVTRSACYFVVRCLTDPDAPASGGAFAPVTVRAPEGSLVNARPPAAVAAGNVETSSRIADVVFRALGLAQG